MSFNRKQEDSKRGKIRNPVARFDNNRGGFHTKSKKAERSNVKQQMNQMSQDDDWDETIWDIE